MKWRFDPNLLIELDPIYQRRVDGWLAKALVDRHDSWQSLLRMLPGVFPTDVWAGLERLNYPINQLGVTAPARYERDAASAYRIFRTVEHPADYEWRFTGEGITELCRVATDILPDHLEMNAACLGCPSIFVAGIQELPVWNWALFDRRAHLVSEATQNGAVVSCDLSEPLRATKSFDLAFVDPPWYSPITKCFLANAGRLLKPGGLVLLSMPAAGTRTTAEFDLNEILTWCPAQGFRHEATIHASLPYSTPYFESRCLQSAGFSADVPSWRRGDLIVLKLENTGQATTSAFGSKQNQRPVHEVWIKGVKFVVIGNSNGGASLSGRNAIEPVWIEPTLPSVSTRFPGRSEANIITSGNRFFQCSDPECIVSYLTDFAKECDNRAMNKNDNFKDVLAEIVEREIREVHAYNEYFR